MKKLSLKLDLNFLEQSKGSLWQKALLGVALATLGLTLSTSVYLALRPISKEMKMIIDKEISSTNINFDQKTLESIKARQVPREVPETTTGKNPFTSF